MTILSFHGEEEFFIDFKIEQCKRFVDVAILNREELSCSMANCFCWPDFENSLPEFAKHIASCAPSFSFNSDDARFTNEVDGTEIVYEISYDGRGNLSIYYCLDDPEQGEFERDFNYVLKDGAWSLNED